MNMLIVQVMKIQRKNQCQPYKNYSNCKGKNTGRNLGELLYRRTVIAICVKHLGGTNCKMEFRNNRNGKYRILMIKNLL